MFQIEAEDPDSGSNGEVTYSFSSGASARISEMFSIDSSTGVITVKKSLEYSGRVTYCTSVIKLRCLRTLSLVKNADS